MVYNITKQAGGERNNDKNNMYSVLEVTRSHKLSKITENEDLMPKQNSIESNKQKEKTKGSNSERTFSHDLVILSNQLRPLHKPWSRTTTASQRNHSRHLHHHRTRLSFVCLNSQMEYLDSFTEELTRFSSYL